MQRDRLLGTNCRQVTRVRGNFTRASSPDLYAEKSEMLDTEYLVVECKCKGKVSAKDIVRFINKVDSLYKNLPEILFKPPL